MSCSSTSPMLAEQCGRFVLDELLTTEQQYVDDLSNGLERYSRIFVERKASLPVGLAGQQHILLANISQIVALHRHEVLPLMQRHRQRLEQLFENWRDLLNRDLFYCYVLFTASQRASLRLYDSHELYFKRLQITLGDPLGIRSFLLKPVQRITKYPLLMAKFIKTFYDHRQLISKRLFEVACRLETRLRELLDTANQSDLLNDIKHFNAYNILNEASFITVGDFAINELTLRRSYNCKLFVFNTCLIYTEIKGKKLIFRGNFFLPDICFMAKTKSFVLCNKQRECEFLCLPAQLIKWEGIVRQLLEQPLPPARTKMISLELQHQSPSTTTTTMMTRMATNSRTIWYTSSSSRSSSSCITTHSHTHSVTHTSTHSL